jgi:hypothetical protein
MMLLGVMMLGVFLAVLAASFASFASFAMFAVDNVRRCFVGLPRNTVVCGVAAFVASVAPAHSGEYGYALAADNAAACKCPELAQRIVALEVDVLRGRQMNVFNQSETGVLLGKQMRKLKNKAPRAHVYYQSGSKTNYDPIARTVLTYQPDWQDVFIAVTLMPFGAPDRMDPPHTLRRLRWAKHLQELGLDQDFSLFHLPGIRFGQNEFESAVNHIISIMDFGWDATLFLKPTKLQAFFSHDDRIEIWAAPQPRQFVQQLINAGCRAPKLSRG